MDTFSLEDQNQIPFFNKIPVSIERGEGVYVWDENGRRYLDFTAGWGVTCLGHSHPVIIKAITDQTSKIIQNPSSGLTYSPARAKLMSVLRDVLPDNLTKVFFSSSGAESNDAAIKLARKISGRPYIISANMSFHGRTISTVSATGQAKHREKFFPVMPNYKFVPFNDINAMKNTLDDSVAAVILEPIQGEGGVNLPNDNYMEEVYELCRKNNTYMIFDEIQTGFLRTGSMFAVDDMNIEVDFLTMAKGIAGGFPFGAFAVTDEVAEKIEIGDHGGTYCGNPLGCAVAHAVISHLAENGIQENVKKCGELIVSKLNKIKEKYPETIVEIRGKGLLIAIEFRKADDAQMVYSESINEGLFVNITQGNIIRLFPALNIKTEEAEEGFVILEKVVERVSNQ